MFADRNLAAPDYGVVRDVLLLRANTARCPPIVRKLCQKPGEPRHHKRFSLDVFRSPTILHKSVNAAIVLMTFCGRLWIEKRPIKPPVHERDSQRPVIGFEKDFRLAFEARCGTSRLSLRNKAFCQCIPVATGANVEAIFARAAKAEADEASFAALALPHPTFSELDVANNLRVDAFHLIFFSSQPASPSKFALHAYHAIVNTKLRLVSVEPLLIQLFNHDSFQIAL